MFGSVCTLIEEKVEWFTWVVLVVSSIKMSVVVLGLWFITGRGFPHLIEHAIIYGKLHFRVSFSKSHEIPS